MPSSSFSPARTDDRHVDGRHERLFGALEGGSAPVLSTRPPTGPRDIGASVVVGVALPLLLRGLESLVDETAGLALAGSAGELDRFVALCRQVDDAVALVDPALSREDLREFLLRLKHAAPRLRVVLLMDTHHPQLVRAAVQAGACGILCKDAHAGEIRAALSAAAQGRRYIAPQIAANLAEAITVDELTRREMQVLGKLSQGDCNKTIARDLAVSVGTVKTHVRAIMLKLASKSRTEAVHRAYRLGLVRLDH